MKIGILGGGSWGTAMAYSLSRKHDIIIYIRNEEDANFLNEKHENKKYLKGKKLPENIRASADILEVLNQPIVINAIPTQQIRSVLEKNARDFKEDTIIVNLSKGLENKTYKRISEIFKEFLPANRFVALSGPSHAEEVILDMPTSLVASSLDENAARTIQKEFMSDSLRIYTNDDLIGVELGSAVKNVLALGIGIIDGLGYGDNPKAALMTRGIHEMVRFSVAMGGKRNTLYGLTGLGDLIVTATSRHSRNRLAGELIGKGHTLEDLSGEINMVVEGITTAKALYEMSEKEEIYMPITKEINALVYEGQDISTAADNLMNKAEKEEFDF